MFKFSVDKKAKDGKGRAGTIKTPHGIVRTPAFIPVGTKATVKSLTPEQVRDDVCAEAVLANTYHLYLAPGHELIRSAGGLGAFMNWTGPTFTDSGGFQAFSLRGGMKNRSSKFSKSGTTHASEAASPEGRAEGERSADDGGIDMAKVDDDGVTFKSVIDGSTHRFTPEASIHIQHAIGADIIFTLDECARPDAPHEEQKRAVERTTKWGARCLAEHKKLGGDQALYGIVQGGRFEDLRRESAAAVSCMEFDGFGIGGTFDKTDMSTAVGWVTDVLPENKPRHLLGIGEPEDILSGIKNGADTFDCVSPTRLGRNGTIYTSEGKLNLLNARFAKDMGPLDHRCSCRVCTAYTRSYIAHLFRAKEMLAATLASVHNLHFLVALAAGAREAILSDRFDAYAAESLRNYM